MTAPTSTRPETRQARHVARHPERHRARRALGEALRRGRIERGSCCPAGADCASRIEAHHERYGWPFRLVVAWASAQADVAILARARGRTERHLSPSGSA